MENLNRKMFCGFAGIASVFSMSFLSLNAYAEGNVNLNDEIKFADSQVKELCLKNWDANHDGKFTYAEAASVTSLGKVFGNQNWDKWFQSFNELQYFTGLKSISDGAFYYCNNLHEITMPANVTSIGKQAFYNCQSLKSDIIINNVTTIGEGAFQDCHDIKFVEFNSVKNIGKDAFKDCQNLNGFVLPACLETIGESAFANLYSLRYFYSQKAVPATAGKDVFNMAHDCLLYVPQGSVTAYQTAANWETRFYAPRGWEIQQGRNQFYDLVVGFNSVVVGDAEGNEEEVIVDKEVNVVIDESKVKSFEVESDVEVNSVKYIRSFNNYTWQALYLPVAVSVAELEENFEVAEIGTSSNSTAVSFLDFEGDVKPNKPYAIRLKQGKACGKYTINCNNKLVATKDTVMHVNGSYLLKSTYKYMNSTAMSGKYVLSGSAFAKCSKGATLNAFRFYLESTGNSGRGSRAKEIEVLFDEETAIETIAAEEVANDKFQGVAFDLNGRAVKANAKGLVIVDGKKYLK